MREAQARCDSHEFSEWRAYMTVEPVGAARTDYQFAVLLWFHAMLNRDPKKPKPKFKDFMEFFDFWQTKQPQTQDEIKSVLMSFAQCHNAALKETDGNDS